MNKKNIVMKNILHLKINKLIQIDVSQITSHLEMFYCQSVNANGACASYEDKFSILFQEKNTDIYIRYDCSHK